MAHQMTTIGRQIQADIQEGLDLHHHFTKDTGRDLFFEMLYYLSVSLDGISEEELCMLLGDWRQADTHRTENSALSQYHFKQLLGSIGNYFIPYKNDLVCVDEATRKVILKTYFNDTDKCEPLRKNYLSFFYNTMNERQNDYCLPFTHEYVRRDSYHETLLSYQGIAHIDYHYDKKAKTPVLFYDSSKILIHGDNSRGKTAFLINWAKEYKANHPMVPFIEHYIEAGGRCSNWVFMLLKYLHYFEEHFQFSFEMPSSKDELLEVFSQALTFTGHTSPIIFVIDTLHLLETDTHNLFLKWIPRCMPKNTHFIVSTNYLNAIKPEEHCSLLNSHKIEIKKMAVEEKKHFLTQLQTFHTRPLSEEIITNILNNEYIDTPHIIKRLVNTLIGCPNEHELQEQCNTLFSTHTPTINKLDMQYFNELKSHTDENTCATIDTLLLSLYVSEDGLLESECRDILNNKKLSLSSQTQDPLINFIKEKLISRSDTYTFKHSSFKQALVDSYKKFYYDKNEKRFKTEYIVDIKGHEKKLMNYFKCNSPSKRNREEFIKLAMQTGSKHDLCTYLSDFKNLEKCYREDWPLAELSWEVLETKNKKHTSNPHSLIEVYKEIIEHPESNIKTAEVIESLISNTPSNGKSLALDMRETLTIYYEKQDDLFNLTRSLGRLGELYIFTNQHEKGMDAFRRKAVLNRKMGTLENQDVPDDLLGYSYFIEERLHSAMKYNIKHWYKNMGWYKNLSNTPIQPVDITVLEKCLKELKMAVALFQKDSKRYSNNLQKDLTYLAEKQIQHHHGSESLRETRSIISYHDRLYYDFSEKKGIALSLAHLALSFKLNFQQFYGRTIIDEAIRKLPDTDKYFKHVRLDMDYEKHMLQILKNFI